MLESNPARNRELSTGLLRQRRNLLISSIALIVFVALGFELEQVRIFGNVAKVNNPHTVPILIFIVHFYFTIRYWQYYLEENNIPDILECIESNIRDYEVAHFSDKARKKLCDLYNFEHVNFSYPRYEVITWGEPKQIINDRSISFSKKEVCVHAQIYSKDIECKFLKNDDRYHFIDKAASECSWDILNDGLEEENSRGVIVESWIECSKLKLCKFKMMAVIKYLLKQSYFSDYQWPLMLSLCAFAFSLAEYIGLIKI